MADMDTSAKRLSTLDWDQPFQPGIPIPTGATSSGARQHGMWMYSGIESANSGVTGPYRVDAIGSYVSGSAITESWRAESHTEAYVAAAIMTEVTE